MRTPTYVKASTMTLSLVLGAGTVFGQTAPPPPATQNFKVETPAPQKTIGPAPTILSITVSKPKTQQQAEEVTQAKILRGFSCKDGTCKSFDNN